MLDQCSIGYMPYKNNSSCATKDRVDTEMFKGGAKIVGLGSGKMSAILAEKKSDDLF
jgi:hypothetical protein